MPIYEYQCSACGHELEKFQKISDDPITLCPECGSESLQKKISAAAFQLKGSGWYQTDFKDPKPKTGTTNKKEDKPAQQSTQKNSSSSKKTTSDSSG